MLKKIVNFGRIRKKRIAYTVLAALLVSHFIYTRFWNFLNTDENTYSERSIEDKDFEESKDIEINTYKPTTKKTTTTSKKTTTEIIAYKSADELAIARNKERLETLREQCRIKQNDKTRNATGVGFFNKQYIRGLTDERFSLVYCRINKCASTFTISTLSKLLQWPIDKFRRFSTEFRKLNYPQKLNIFDNALTFLFVREPYGRLFSTYGNKFYLPKGNFAPVGPEIVRRYRKNPSANSLQYGHDITFAELIRFTVEDYNSGSRMDAHIRPMHVNCKPCDFNYDFIGKLETMVPDWQYLVHEMRNRNIISAPPKRAGQKKASKELGEMKHFFETLEKLKNTTIDKYHLYKRAWRYFQMTSVISKKYEMPFNRITIRNVNNVTFLKEMEKASKLSKTNLTDLKLQKYEAMIQAYNTVPRDLLEEFRKVVLDDCLLFGYDDRPRLLFDTEYNKPYKTTFDYFSDLGPFK